MNNDNFLFLINFFSLFSLFNRSEIKQTLQVHRLGEILNLSFVFKQISNFLDITETDLDSKRVFVIPMAKTRLDVNLDIEDYNIEELRKLT